MPESAFSSTAAVTVIDNHYRQPYITTIFNNNIVLHDAGDGFTIELKIKEALPCRAIDIFAVS